MADTQRASQTGCLTVISTTGVKNFMAYVTYHSFGKNHEPETFCLSHFYTTLPLQQKKYWRHVPLTPDMTSLVTSMLHGTWLPLQKWMTGYKPKNGKTGWNSARTSGETVTWRKDPPPPNSTSSSVFAAQNRRRYFLFLFFSSGLRDPIVCWLLGGGIPSQKSGYKVTRIRPSIMLSCFCVPLPSFLARHRL